MWMSSRNLEESRMNMASRIGQFMRGGGSRGTREEEERESRGLGDILDWSYEN